MKKRMSLLSILIMLLAGCAAFDTAINDDDNEVIATEESVQNTPTSEVTTPEANQEETESIVESNRPDWHFVELTDVNTGETFTLADLEGKTVFVETMATWCSNCRKQLQNVRTARNSLEGENFVFLALSLEANLKNDDLANYTSREDFGWTFAVMSEDLIRAFADEFGRSVTNAPSTPHFIIRPDGTYTELVTGIDSPEEIVSEMNKANGA